MNQQSKNNSRQLKNDDFIDEEVLVFKMDDLDFPVDEVQEVTAEDFVQEAAAEDFIKEKKRKVKKTKTKTKKTSKIKTKKPTAKHDKEKQSKRNIGAILAILVLIAAAIFASWELYFSFDEYNPFDYIQIIEKGADTQAYLEIEKDQIVLDDKATLVRDLSEFAILKNEDLSIGDEREIAVVLDEESKAIFKKEKIRLSPMSMIYTLGQVSELENINVLDALEITYAVEGNKVRIESLDAQVSDLDLKELLLFDATDKLLAFEDNFKVSIKDTAALEGYLIENGLTIKQMEKEFTVEAFSFVPETLTDLGDIAMIESDAVESLALDLNADGEIFENFSVRDVCYTDEALNEVNARDKNYGHAYTKGSLMFVVEFNRIDDEAKMKYADTIGYTNIVMEGENIDQNQILAMNPLYEEATYDMVKRDMVQNNFNCKKN